MSRTPEEILNAKKLDIKPIIEKFDKYLEEKFDGEPVHIDYPRGLTRAGFQALVEHYQNFNWVVTSGSDRNESYLVFTPVPVPTTKDFYNK